MENSNAQGRAYTGTGTATKILPHEKDRSYICFFAVSGDCEISIGPDDFETTKILLPAGTMWEPNVALQQEIWYKGVGTNLCIIS